MRKVNVNEIKEDPWQSPKGKFAVAFRGISEALGRGRVRESGHRVSVDGSTPPFDLEWNRMPPGKLNFPFHAHSAQWEMYLIVSGKASVRDKDGTSEVGAGDAFIFGPNEPHQITNSGDTDLIYYVIADNPLGESGYYPDSGKWKLNKTSQADRVVIKGKEVDYFDGEE
ncbi:MAG TPA: cupin domain-containing protein [Chthoniobacterales bacterium]|nr:cupin domain-containing protein [Chthoniobacterales bacterium]